MAQEEVKKYPTIEYEQYSTTPIDYQQAYQGANNAYDEYMTRLAYINDPQRQERQDSQINMGKMFWTGAQVLGNAIANMVNVNQVAAGAPSAKTFENDSWNQMYKTWQDVDNNLRAERRAAQDRYEQMGLAKMKLNGDLAAKGMEYAQAMRNKNTELENRKREKEFDARQRLDAAQTQLENQKAIIDYRGQKEKDVYAHNLGLRENSEKKEKMTSISIPNSLGADIHIDSKDENEYNKNINNIKFAVQRFVDTHPHLFQKTLQPDDRGYKNTQTSGKESEIKALLGENTEPVKVQIGAEDIKDPIAFISEYDLMKYPEFRQYMKTQFPDVKFDYGTDREEMVTKGVRYTPDVSESPYSSNKTKGTKDPNDLWN